MPAGSICQLVQPKKCPYFELFWSAYSRIWTEHGEILSISLYSVRMRENADQNNSEYVDFLRSVAFYYLSSVSHNLVKKNLFSASKGVAITQVRQLLANVCLEQILSFALFYCSYYFSLFYVLF